MPDSPDSVSCEKSFSMNVCGALKYSLNSAVVGGGESRLNASTYGLCRLVDDGLALEAGVSRSDVRR